RIQRRESGLNSLPEVEACPFGVAAQALRRPRVPPVRRQGGSEGKMAKGYASSGSTCPPSFSLLSLGERRAGVVRAAGADSSPIVEEGGIGIQLRRLFFALALLYVLPFWTVHHLPTVDGPCHAYNAWILRQHGNTAEYPLFQQYYEI